MVALGTDVIIALVVVAVVVVIIVFVIVVGVILEFFVAYDVRSLALLCMSKM